ncbi:hypothetical protein J5834_02665 [bacterium]|nr:hypothetical protein [bacterium]
MRDFLGIDIGSTFITVFSRNENRVVLRKRHRGRAGSMLKKFFAESDKDTLVKFTGKSANEFAEALGSSYMSETEAINSCIKNGNYFKSGSGAIIDIGASSLTKYVVKSNEITDISSNALCAAGTGLFLEEQAERLSIDLENMPMLDIDNPPAIASRCTVFAKSDLIHHQQEGRTKDEMWAGMCRALTISATNTLFRGLEVKGEILLVGGVSLNAEVVRWFKKLFPAAFWSVPESSEAFAAKGACYKAETPVSEVDTDCFTAPTRSERMPSLTLKKSKYPHFIDPTIDENRNEIRIHKDFSGISEVIMGMDIGSTSTKIAVLTLDGTPVLDIYRKTGGDPINAAKKIFEVLFRLMNPEQVKIRAFGTTGSGRKLVGEIFGADAIVNEITAHGTGTASIYPDVETIFEIGGQDAKFIRLKNGYVTDVNMNYVCAAGTGSFVEEQARKLDIPIEKAGELTEGIEPPVTSDRCTVFMEQDIRALLKQGFFKEEVLASVLYSVTKNYLNRVVGNRKISRDKIFFQGATARNKGLVAAFENLLDVEMVVSPFCHVMGCIGAALIAYEELRTVDPLKDSAFIGPESVTLKVSSRTEICKLCNNFCRINFISKNGGAESSWGYGCGRDPETKSRKEIEEFQLVKLRNQTFFSIPQPTEPIGTVGIPLAISNQTYLPLWREMFTLLNIKTELSAPSTTHKIKELSSKFAASDFCFPLKTSIGHTAELLDRKLPVFFPTMISAGDKVNSAISFFCPYVEGASSVISSTMKKNGIHTDSRLLDPVIDFRMTDEQNGEEIYNALKPLFKITKKQVIKAFSTALQNFRERTVELISKGEAYLKKMMDEERPVFLLVGRPYNLYDKGINLGIPETIAGMGWGVVPMDLLDLDVSALENSNYWNLFWNYGQRIIAALRRAKKEKMVFPIYLTNFSCGPDSFILSFAENEMKGRPMLILELDEHDSDGGYLTRIEAFIDVVKGYLKSRPQQTEFPLPEIFTQTRRIDIGKVWIPPIHIVSTPLFAAAFRAYGYDAEAIPPETKKEYSLGKRYTRGQECLPMILTLGGFMNQAKKDPERRHVLFMPTSEGPCRFGQYNLLERIAFENAGLKNVDIFSPSSVNSYQGIEEELWRYLMPAMMTGDILLKLRTKTRPYEKTKGDVDALFAESLAKLIALFEKREDPKYALREIAKKFAAIPRYTEKKPLVGIVGEIYARCNEYANGHVIDVVEKNGGEAWLSPIHEWMLYTAWLQNYMSRKKKFSIFGASESLLKNIYLFRTEEAYYKLAGELLADRHEPPVDTVIKEGMKYIHPEFAGEAILTIGRGIMFAKQGAAMIVNIAPFGCMHGTITDSIFQEIKSEYKIPVVSQFYDGDIKINGKVADILKMR